jgi:predicted neuraminidase
MRFPRLSCFLSLTAFFSLAAALVHGASAESPAAQPGIVLSEPIFTGIPYPQSKPGKPGGPVQAQSHSSTIVETKSGLVAAWFGGTKEGNPDVGIWLSRHVGGKWTPPVEVANGAETEAPRVNCLNPVLFQVPDGPLLLFYRTGKWWPYVKRSMDDGVTWSKPERLYNGNFGPIKNKPVLLPDGSILSPASTEFSGWPAPGATGWDSRMWRVQFERLALTGNRAAIKATQWQVIGPVNDGAIDAIQPSILLHPGNRLQALGRTAQGGIFQIWSDDGGRTWGEMTLTGLPNPNSGTDAVTLQDGRHLLVYNHTGQRPEGKNGPRFPLNVAVSADGKNWRGALVLENQPGEFSYPAVIQTADGLVHITYTHRRQHIRHVVVDPAKLVLRDMGDGKWPEQ